METQAEFGFKELFAHVVGDMAKAVCERNGETRQQQFARSRAATHTIMGFLPRDVIEAMLAGRCVMLHEVMMDSVHATLTGEIDRTRRATRSNIVALDKAFGDNLTRLELYRTRNAEGRRDASEAPPADASTAPQAADTDGRAGEAAERTDPAADPDQAAPARVPPVRMKNVPDGTQAEALAPLLEETTMTFTPSPEVVAACRANPEAMAALDAGDAGRFARAVGIDLPSDAFLVAAAGPGSPFDRRAAANGRLEKTEPREVGGDEALRQAR